jgi:predicted nuclease of predicted toxin-antitoxin system
MKLLLDQNLSHRLINAVGDIYPGTTQVSLLGMGEATDKSIWEYAQQHGFAIVTLDADFQEYSVLWSGPPLVIWLRCGNQPTQVVRDKLLRHRKAIEQAQDDPNTWCIEIY